jgi:hypothetical protein
MRKPLLWGIAAGAVGTITLDVVTYVDMVARARPASSTPAEVAGALADRAGVELAAGGNDTEPADNRRSGLGALFGYGVGLGVGAAYGLLRSLLPRRAGRGRRPLPWAWRRWPRATCRPPRSGSPTAHLGRRRLGVRSAPHLAYGLATVYQALAGQDG